jgi:hypothetical protein
MKKNLLALVFILMPLLPAVARTVIAPQPETPIIESELLFEKQEALFIEPEATITESDTIPSDPQETPQPQSSVTLDGSLYDFIFSWKKKANESHWTGFGFAFSNLNGLNKGDLDMSRSYSVVLNVGDYVLPINRNWLMATGLGFDWSRYHFRGNRRLTTSNDHTALLPDPDRTYRDSKLLIYYATIPVLLEYQTKISRNKSFFVYGGLEGLLKLYSKSQVEVRMPEGIRKEASKDLNLLPLNLRLTGSIGFSDFSLFGYYQPFSMFEKGAGPDLCPYGLGIMLNF